MNNFKFSRTFKGVATDPSFSLPALSSTLESVSTNAVVAFFGFERIIEDSAQIPPIEGLHLQIDSANSPKIDINSQSGIYTIIAFYAYFSLPCESSCATCSAVSEADCLTCSDNLPKDSTSGLCKCPNGQYRAATTGICTTCDSSCTTCSESATHCLTCPDLFPITASNTCECPSGSYRDNVTGGCSACDPRCTSCTSLTVCTSCVSTAYLEPG